MGESMGKLFSGLTQPYLEQNGQARSFDNPAAAMGAANQSLSSAPKQTLTSNPATVTGSSVATEGAAPDLTFSGGDAKLEQPPVNLPRYVKPSFGDASGGSGKFTSKGTVLKLLLESGLGAAAGAGSRTVGEGSARALQAQKARSDLVTQANEQEQQRANLADLPGDKARAVAHTEAVTDLAKAQASSIKDFVPVQVPNADGTTSTQMVPRKSMGTVVKAQLDNATKQNIADNKPLSPIDVGKGFQNAVANSKDPGNDPVVADWKRKLDFINKSAPKGSLDSQLAQAYRDGNPREIAILENVVKKTRTDPRMAMVLARPVKITDPTDGSEYWQYASNAIGDHSLATTGANLQKNAFTPAARFNDIERAYTSVDKSIGAYDGNDSQRGLIVTALQDGNKENPGVLKTFTKSKLFKEMDPPSRDLVTGVLSLREQIMGINQVLTGSSTSSDVRTAAIWNTLPDGSEPDSDMARRKMKLVRGMIDNLRQGFPMIDKVGKSQGGTSKATHRYNPTTGQIEAINGK